MLKESADIKTLLINNFNFAHLLTGADGMAFDRACEFISNRFKELGYVLVHNSDLTISADAPKQNTVVEQSAPVSNIPTTSSIKLLNLKPAGG